jgi:hypothetical protein
LWLGNGWVDYLAPQLYWPINAPQQSFPVLLNWWTQQNAKGRGIFAGLSAASVGEKFSAAEIGRQVQATRAQPGANGEIYFHLKNITANRDLADVLHDENHELAVMPAMPWSSRGAPAAPRFSAAFDGKSALALNWQADTNYLRCWVLQMHTTNNVWSTRIFPPGESGYLFSESPPDIVALSAMDRFGMLSPAAVLKREPGHSPKKLMYIRE